MSGHGNASRITKTHNHKLTIEIGHANWRAQFRLSILFIKKSTLRRARSGKRKQALMRVFAHGGTRSSGKFPPSRLNRMVKPARSQHDLSVMATRYKRESNTKQA